MEMSYQDIITQDRRLSLLLVLSNTPGYSANVFLLRDAVRDIYGHNASVDQVRTDLAWLSEQGTLTARNVGDVALATLTTRGLDAAAGRTHVPGIKQPLP